MAKKKQKLREKKSNAGLVYAGLGVLLIAALLVYFPAPGESQEKLPTAGEYVKLNMPTTYEPGKVKIIEFLKFDCPHCYDLDRDMPQILEKYGDKIQVTYVPVVWPGQSTKSIEAYIIAEQMGKGEEMRDALFRAVNEDRKDMSSITVLEDTAASIGLGADFNTKLENNDAREAARSNLELRDKYGVQGTPTVIINGNLDVKPSIANLDAVIGSLLS